MIKSVVLILLILTSCSSEKKNLISINKSEKNAVIKYADLEIIYNYFLKKNEKAIKLLEKKKQIKNEKNKMFEIEKEIEKIKSGILRQINTAVKKVALEKKYDFIFNKNDTLLYGKKNKDVTNEIIEKIHFLQRRSSPITR